MKCDVVWYSLVGDALSLGPHWIYDQGEIGAKLGRIGGYHAPLSGYHPGKQAGDFTHYGDQTMLLLRSVAGCGAFDLNDFASRWRAFWDDPAAPSYRDAATRATLGNLQGGRPVNAAGSPSSDMGGASRIAPLFLLDWGDPAELFAAARAQTSFTHADPAVGAAAEFFARVAHAVGQGSPIPAALAAAATQPTAGDAPRWLAAALATSKSPMSDRAALSQHGLTCDVGDAFPAVCHLLLRFPDDPASALCENAMAGGDSAARGLLLGLVFGSVPQPAPIPGSWVATLAARDEIISLANSIA